MTEPLRGLVPTYTSSRALPQPGPDGRMNPATQMAARLQTAMVDLAVDGWNGILYGWPRSAVGYVSRLDGPALAAWAEANLPRWQHLDAAGWDEAAQLLYELIRERDAADVAAVPGDARRAAELNAERVRAARKAGLQRQAAQAQAELAALADAPDAEHAPRGGRWMRRAPAP